MLKRYLNGKNSSKFLVAQLNHHSDFSWPPEVTSAAAAFDATGQLPVEMLLFNADIGHVLAGSPPPPPPAAPPGCPLAWFSTETKEVTNETHSHCSKAEENTRTIKRSWVLIPPSAGLFLSVAHSQADATHDWVSSKTDA